MTSTGKLIVEHHCLYYGKFSWMGEGLYPATYPCHESGNSKEREERKFWTYSDKVLPHYINTITLMPTSLGNVELGWLRGFGGREGFCRPNFCATTTLGSVWHGRNHEPGLSTAMRRAPC